MAIHIPTLFLAIIVTSATLAVSVGSVAYRRNRDGLFYWAIALTLHTIAYVLFDLRGEINNFTSIAVANGMLAGSFAMFAESLFQFQQRASPRWLIWLPVLFIAASFVFLLDQPRMRIFISGIIFSVQGLIVFVPLRQKRRETIGRGQHFLATGLALVIAIFMLRAVGAATGVVEIISHTASNSVQAGTYLSSLVSMVLLSLGFLLMTKERADERNYLLAIQDALTGLANRRRMNEILASEWARAKRIQQPLAFIMFDVDLFKHYNDQYGHQAGDECLKRVARVLQSNAQRAGDLAARYGGEEFCLVLSNTDAAAAKRIAEAVRQAIVALGLPHEESPEGKVTLSAGVAIMADNAYKGVDELLRAADSALYRAKHGGRNRIEMAPEALEQVDGEGRQTAHFVRLVWHPAYECGNRVIDEQHQALFDHANSLIAAILSSRSKDELSAMIDALILAVVQHFKDEEAIIAATAFPGVSEHLAIHRELVNHAGALARRFHDGTLVVGDLFQFLAHDVVARHMLGDDRKFFPYLKAPRSQ